MSEAEREAMRLKMYGEDYLALRDQENKDAQSMPMQSGADTGAEEPEDRFGPPVSPGPIKSQWL